jgi:DNA-binding NarL/FixJ family response regulator
MMNQTRTIRVLVIEDHLVSPDGITEALSRNGDGHDIEVVGAAVDYSAAQRLIEKVKPHILLLDLNLPGSPGPKSMIRQLKELGNHKVIALTGEERSIFMQAALDAGADACVLKSKPASILAEQIRRLRDEDEVQVPPESNADLSGAEISILRMLARGLRYHEIADKRASTISTVGQQIDRMQSRLNLNSRESLMAWAAERGLGVGE